MGGNHVSYSYKVLQDFDYIRDPFTIVSGPLRKART